MKVRFFFILFLAAGCTAIDDSLEKIRADFEVARNHGTPDGDLIALSERCAKLIDLSTDKSQAFEAVHTVCEISKIKPLAEIAAALAKGVDRYVEKFDADDISTWQPVFTFFWYHLRRPPRDVPMERQLQLIDGYKSYLDAIFAHAKTAHLKALALYAKTENRLLFERELGVLTEAERDEAVRDVKMLLKNFGELKRPAKNKPYWEQPYAHYARGQLREIAHLHIGAVAPNIEGKDLDGMPFKLSDYRGRVVVLNFWGAWCVPCIAMIPKEKALVQKYADEPFALIGVNTDPRLETARSAVKEHGVTWRSFWNGPGGWEGNIAYDWFVQGYPMLYVLDTEGRIRFKSRSDEGLEETVELLLTELKSNSH
ncbi:TlpA family protein disulfide reductase [candidate division KSB1 bacterium]|nr:TlpA family protein disulfide reductase [candidate division KSB1 bacterium]NIR68927.1 TlpA family protein disulfide reductase [candidate division KSB1 bacterium]NIS22581.1 TlpA family protein disulfide reductase [candidate division KSB1 bacterium]NIT69429.1 TlpA family protein disulfide reductase [candidate division KSB1 bacterium]NIU23084.1 TlpA family protein disulfide reductase [candidate division KSB1 bacterium]